MLPVPISRLSALNYCYFIRTLILLFPVTQSRVGISFQILLLRLFVRLSKSSIAFRAALNGNFEFNLAVAWLSLIIITLTISCETLIFRPSYPHDYYLIVVSTDFNSIHDSFLSHYHKGHIYTINVYISKIRLQFSVLLQSRTITNHCFPGALISNRFLDW